MLLPYTDSIRFIEGYKAVLFEVLSAIGRKRKNDIVESLADARGHVAKDASLISNALISLKARGEQVPEDVALAIQSLRVGRWFHLTHTKKYALLLDESIKNAYAVKALTNPLHEIAGGVAVTFEAGVVEFVGCYVGDGIVLQPVYLGSNLKKELN